MTPETGPTTATGGPRGARGLMLLALYLLAFCLSALDSIDHDKPPAGDAAQYLSFAYNLHRYGVFSHEEEKDGALPAPSAYREPGYPAILALCILMSPRLQEMRMADLFQQDLQPRLWPFKAMQAVLLMAASFVAMAIVQQVTGHRLLSWLALALVGLDGTLQAANNVLLSEPLIVLLLSAFTLCAINVARSGTYLHFAAAGVMLGLLALTRASFLYLGIAAAALLAGLAYRMPRHRRRLTTGLAVALLCALGLVAPWMARNAIQLGRVFLTERAGTILTIRAELNTMTAREYMAAFLYWTNSPFLRYRLLPELFGEGAADRLGAGGPEDLGQIARRRRQQVYEEVRSRPQADAALQHEALAKILRHPLRHMAVTLPVAYRGIFVARTAALSFALWACLFVAGYVGLRRRDAPTMAALLPALFCFAFHALATHNIPRYNFIAIPTLWVSLLLVLHELGGMRDWPKPGSDPH